MSRRSPARPAFISAPAPAAAPAWLWGIGVTAIAALVYLPALRNGFIWDDPLVLEQLRAIHGWRDLVFLPNAIPRYYFRPLIFLSFLLDRAVGGETPFAFHCSVVALHALNTALVWWLGVRLFAAPAAAALATLVFAVHPIHVESVAWIAGRSDVIATAFLLASAIMLTYMRLRWTAAAAVMAYFLALLSKEAALGGLLVLPLIDFVLAHRPRWRANAALLLVTVIYFLVRRVALGAAMTGIATTAPAETVIRNLLAAFGFYVSKLVLPIGLSAYVPEVPGGWILPALGVVALSALAAIGALACRHNERRLAFFVWWFVCTLAPALVVIVRMSAQAPLADRYLYLPSVGVCLLLTRLAAFSGRWRAPTWIVITIVGGVLAVMTIARNRVWADDLLFWQDITAKAPTYALGHRELAQIYLRRDQIAEADAALQRALHGKSDRDGRVMTLNNAATLYLRQQRLDDAERALQEALTLFPHAYLYYGLGRVAVSRAEQAQARGDGDEAMRQVSHARDQLTQAVALDPGNAKAHALLGQVLYNLRDLPAARLHLQQALQLGASGSVADSARQYLKMAGG
ncbi:MAG: hypothetical protein HYR72_00940 [Deltaproteobacteria bacterium]|nr:hypothetical protein [Deltaproteobacteria bacterium]MBI3391307.1 hypothetical protein [Deltaproteobacteria bacterium]